MIISNQPFHLQKFQKNRQPNSSGSSDVNKQFALEHTYHVKKPECPARKSGDEWPKWLFL